MLVTNEEARQRELGESSSSLVLNIESRGRNPTRGNGCGKSKDMWSKSRNHRSSNNLKTIECWNYG